MEQKYTHRENAELKALSGKRYSLGYIDKILNEGSKKDKVKAIKKSLSKRK